MVCLFVCCLPTEISDDIHFYSLSRHSLLHFTSLSLAACPSYSQYMLYLAIAAIIILCVLLFMFGGGSGASFSSITIAFTSLQGWGGGGG